MYANVKINRIIHSRIEQSVTASPLNTTQFPDFMYYLRL